MDFLITGIYLADSKYIFIPQVRDSNQEGDRQMNLPTLQQAIRAAQELMAADKAITSVRIEFQTSTGLAFSATWSGTMLNVCQIK